MPKPTFLNLSPAKQTHILESTVGLILAGPIQDITVSDIVKASKIPRGSFYQYFEHLQDLLLHVYESFIERFETYKMQQVQSHAYTLFSLFEDSFEKDYLFFTTSDFQAVYGKLFNERKFVGLDLMAHEKGRISFIQKVLSHVNTDAVKHLSLVEQTDLYILYLRIKNGELHRVIEGSKTYEDAHATFQFYLRILQRGVKAWKISAHWLNTRPAIKATCGSPLPPCSCKSSSDF